MSAQGTIDNMGRPSGDRSVDQLAARERRAGPTGDLMELESEWRTR